MAGTYTCKERVVRDGRLVAFAGQTMTEEEAKRLGLLAKKTKAPEKPEAPEPEPEAPEPKKGKK